MIISLMLSNFIHTMDWYCMINCAFIPSSVVVVVDCRVTSYALAYCQPHTPHHTLLPQTPSHTVTIIRPRPSAIVHFPILHLLSQRFLLPTLSLPTVPPSQPFVTDGDGRICVRWKGGIVVRYVVPSGDNR